MVTAEADSRVGRGLAVVSLEAMVFSLELMVFPVLAKMKFKELLRKELEPLLLAPSSDIAGSRGA